MILVTALDLSLDAKERDEDRFENLKICLDHQKKILDMCKNAKKQACGLDVGLERD